MQTKPKFYVNQGRRCGQAVVRAFVDKNISWQELDDLTGRRKEDITLPIQIAYGFYKLHIPFIYPIKDLFFEENFDKIKRGFDIYGEEIKKKINFEFVKKAKQELNDSGNYARLCNETIEEMKHFRSIGRHPIKLINFDLFVDRENKYSGHYFIINSFNSESVNVMDCGPCNAGPDKRVSLEKLEKSIMDTPLDQGVIFV